jgi:hypothetical protein
MFSLSRDRRRRREFDLEDFDALAWGGDAAALALGGGEEDERGQRVAQVGDAAGDGADHRVRLPADVDGHPHGELGDAGAADGRVGTGLVEDELDHRLDQRLLTLKTRETASPGCRRALEAHLAACAGKEPGSGSTPA